MHANRAARECLIEHDGGEVVHALIIAARGGAARTVDAVCEEHRAERRQRGLVVPPRQLPVSPGNVAVNYCHILPFYGPFRLRLAQQLFEADHALGGLGLNFGLRGLPRDTCRSEGEGGRSGVEGGCFWELYLLSSHFHPSTAVMARTLLAGTHIEYSGDPLKDLSAVNFLSKFVQKKAKAVSSKFSKQREATDALPEAFAEMDESLVDPADLFHYYNQRLRGVVRKDKESRLEKVNLWRLVIAHMAFLPILMI